MKTKTIEFMSPILDAIHLQLLYAQQRRCSANNEVARVKRWSHPDDRADAPEVIFDMNSRPPEHDVESANRCLSNKPACDGSVSVSSSRTDILWATL